MLVQALHLGGPDEFSRMLGATGDAIVSMADDEAVWLDTLSSLDSHTIDMPSGDYCQQSRHSC